MAEKTVQDWELPPLEAVEYGRAVLLREIGRLQGFERRMLVEGNTDGDLAAASRWRSRWQVIEKDLLGFDDGGCVITPFDKRWLDPASRETMTAVRAEIRAAQGTDHG
jgi:hypothetical protein